MRYDRDCFAFANETVFQYSLSNGPALHSAPTTSTDAETKDEPGRPRYTRRCFTMSRATVQFWKFARFAPREPAVCDAELRRRVRLLCARPVWRPALSETERIVIPGYRSLKEFSRAKPSLVQDEIGLGWPVYFRQGNARLLLPVTAAGEAGAHRQIESMLAQGEPPILWLINFPALTINHVVVVLRALPERSTADKIVYEVADPNYSDAPRELIYHPQERAFTYAQTFYFRGGRVNIRPIYRNHLL